MPQPFRIPFPKRGLNRNVERSDQNGIEQGFGSSLLPDSVWNAVNVVPYDRFDRLRGGQRSGTSRLYAAALGPGTAIYGMGSESIAINPATAVPSIPVLTIDFTPVPAGQAVGSIGGSGVDWLVSRGATVVSGGYGVPTFIQQDAGLTVQGTNPPRTAAFAASASNSSTAMWVPPLSFGTSYSVIAKLIPTNLTKGSSGADGGVGIFARVDHTRGTVLNGVFVGVWKDTITLHDVTTNSDLITATVALSAVTPSTIELRVNGNSMSVFANGSQVGTTQTDTNNPSNIGVGFWAGTLAGTPAGVQTFQVLVPSPSRRQTNLVTVTGGNVYVGNLTASSVASGGTGVLTDGIKVSMAFGQGNAYIVDGTNTIKVAIATQAASTLTATAGTVPAGCSIAAVWRDRLVLANQGTAPQNFFFSRVGTHTDFDYSQADPAAAFAGNASTAGHIGDPITALMPFNDDVLLIGGDSNLWRVQGDPADGGSIDLVSDSIGVLSQTAWAKDPVGNIYFLGTGGLYKVQPGGGPQLITGSTLNQYFTGIDRTANFISLEWDRDRQGMYIFITPVNTSNQATHAFYDNRNGGVWFLQYPLTHGPFAACIYDDGTAAGRVMLMGGIAGLIQQTTPTALDDDGTAISSTMTLGPFQPATPSGDAVVTMMDVTLGENFGTDPAAVFNVDVTLKGGKTAYEVTEGTARTSATRTLTTPGYQNNLRQRIRGGWFTVTLANSVLDKYWSVEHVVLHVEGQGKQR